MTQPTRVVPASVAEEIPQELSELATAIAELPADHAPAVRAAFAKVVDGTKRRRRILTLVQEALGQLRLDMKYLVFDLEATRRERDAFKRQIEEGQEPQDPRE
jgi:hypothetical protein